MLAEAMKLQAEATTKISNTIDSMTRNEERQTQLLELIFTCLQEKNV